MSVDGGGHEDQRGDEHEHPVSWRRVGLGTIAALAVGALVVALLGRVAGYSRLSATLQQSDPAWLVICAAGQIVVFAGYAGAYRIGLAFENGPRIRFGLSLRVILAGFGLGQLVAAGGAAGLAVTYWAMLQARLDKRDALVRLIGFNTFIFLIFALMGLGAGIAALVTGAAPLAMSLTWIAAVPVLLLAARWFTARRRVEKWASDGGSWLQRGLAVGVSAAWWVRRMMTTHHGRSAVPWAAAYWAGDIASLWGGLRSVGVEIGLPALLLAYATGYVAGAIPIPFAATGGVDAALTFALHAVGVPLEVALIGVVAHRVFAFWLPLIPGLALAALLPATGRQLEQAAEARPPSAPVPAGS